MNACRHRRAFSLVEVVIAVGLFAGSVTVVLALLPALMQLATGATETAIATRLPDALRLELGRLGGQGLDTLALQAPVLGSTARGGLEFVATRDAARLHSRSYLSPGAGGIAESEQYFLLECWRFADEPLRYETARRTLALVVRVSWPYRLPGSAGVVPPHNRSHLAFTVSVRQ